MHFVTRSLSQKYCLIPFLELILQNMPKIIFENVLYFICSYSIVCSLLFKKMVQLDKCKAKEEVARLKKNYLRLMNSI